MGFKSIMTVFPNSMTVFGIAIFHLKVGHLSRYVCQLQNPRCNFLIKIASFHQNIFRKNILMMIMLKRKIYETYKTQNLDF